MGRIARHRWVVHEVLGKFAEIPTSMAEIPTSVIGDPSLGGRPWYQGPLVSQSADAHDAKLKMD